MYLCNLTCVTDTDGRETTLHTRAELEASERELRLHYADGDASVTVRLGQREACREAFIERTGEYTLSLHLKAGEETVGSLGILGSVGEFSVRTDRVEYLWRKEKLMALLSYTLVMSGEKQKMKVRLTTSLVRESEE